MEHHQVCSHIVAIKELKTAKETVCEQCVKDGSDWVHLRTCQTCGITLCCDSSPMQHMSHHCSNTKHPVVISSEPGERWLYCYIDDEMAEY
ncbi:UBP-type zinc finger domain-containing protein [Pedobacter sp. BMA]|uniref:UBP-type zinc finger domain-containing protein n=1 Tax=Pedobacter sp. BMA TaxID=1663685 RepID=UPI0009E2385D|nr:UBP-type zinc finger domain-containing protein [Pedobacter sp. BMA]